MTMNKAQDQSLKAIGLKMDNDVFSSCQLHVGLEAGQTFQLLIHYYLSHLQHVISKFTAIIPSNEIKCDIG